MNEHRIVLVSIAERFFVSPEPCAVAAAEGSFFDSMRENQNVRESENREHEKNDFVDDKRFSSTVKILSHEFPRLDAY